MKIKLTVCKSSTGQYYAVRSFPENISEIEAIIDSEVFSIEKDISSQDVSSLNDFEEEAKKKARKFNIPFVNNLD